MSPLGDYRDHPNFTDKGNPWKPGDKPMSNENAQSEDVVQKFGMKWRKPAIPWSSRSWFEKGMGIFLLVCTVALLGTWLADGILYNHWSLLRICGCK